MSTIEGTVDARQVMEWSDRYVMGTYARQPVVFVRGQGARLWDADGREYLDFLAGIAVCGVGHCHPRVARAVSAQAAALMHTSNLFYNPLQPALARRLCEATGMDRAFFCNSGAEANECAIKIARKWARQHRGPDCCEIITFHGSFHGRTLATVTATAQPKYQAPFAPLPEGFRYVHVGDLAELDESITEQTAAVMIEPIQGESGIQIVPPEFLAAIRALCDESGILLILDEVQSGMGRTGCFLASQRAGVQGDIVTLAKSLASGIPMGACLARGTAATTLVPGDHGSTFGGQPVACAAALAVLDVMEEKNLCAQADRVGGYFLSALRALAAEMPGRVAQARGVGLMVGLELAVPRAGEALGGLMRRGVIANAVGDRILRFLPPLVVTEADCDRVVAALRETLAQV
ncbi:MAG: acetylornithine transaminase [Chthonomonadales bacterium]|nr:acetylornithine transaminase [Chthonomonadales bacterium]